MSTSKLKKSQPILNLFAPTDTDAASFIEPAQCPFNNPAPGRKAQFAGDGALIYDRFIFPTPMLDMRCILFFLNKFVNVIVVITLICTKVLLEFLRVRSINNHLDDEIVSRPFVMFIRSSDMQRERCAKLINQKMNFSAAFASISRVFARLLASERCAGQALLSIDCHSQPIPCRLL